MRFVLAAVAALTLTVPTTAGVAKTSPSSSCDRSCVQRVKREIRREVRARHARALRREMRYYRAHPMPSCTWAGESSPPGDYSHPFPPSSRYTAKNPYSTASGKFQILTSTWLSNGGGRYAREARFAKPVYQERVARRVARAGISNQWANC